MLRLGLRRWNSWVLASAVLGCGSDGAAVTAGDGEGDSTAADAGDDDPSADDDGSTGQVSASQGTTADADTGDTSDSVSTTNDTTAGDETTSGDGSSSGGGETTTGDEGEEATTVEEICEAPGELISCDADTTDPFQAMGLNCAGEANEVIPILNASFTSPDAASWRIARQFGTYIDPNTNEPLWSAHEGEQFLIISSGHIDAPDENGVITMAAGVHDGGINSANQDDKPLPAPMSPFEGSDGGNGGTPFVDCDGINDCSDTLLAQWNAGGDAANDLLWFQFEVVVPGGTHGFSFDFVYFSAEFPEWVNTTFNDIFVVWSNSETYTGNLCFVNDQPCTVTALWPADFASPAPELDGTGFEQSAATNWYEAKASAEPGEVLQLTWAVFDMGDTAWDTAVILDNWHWDCEGCVPSEVMGCGIDPM
jgi:hypothetical protein